MASSSNDKICIRCRESLKENDPLNHVGARYRDNQNEKHPLQIILEQAQALKLDNLASNIEENLQSKTPVFIRLSCRDYLRNNSRPKKRSMGDAQQIFPNVLRGDLTLRCLILRANVFIVKNLVLKTKNMQIEKILKLLVQ